MQYLNDSFWRTIVGFVVVIIMGVGFLYLSQFYGQEEKASPENFMAGSEAGQGTNR